MCDYSLHGIPNRLAEEGEVLVVHRFFTGSKGLTSHEYLKPTAQPKGLMAMLKTIGNRPLPEVMLKRSRLPVDMYDRTPRS
jgi:hypothetical protein